MIPKKLRRGIAALLCMAALLILTACDPNEYGPSDQIIIDASQVSEYLERDDVALLDLQGPEGYSEGHVTGAVMANIEDFVVNVPVKNMLASKSKVEEALQAAGVSQGDTVVLYDTDNVNASRLWWTLLVYGFENVKVVSGGVSALMEEGIPFTQEASQASKGDVKLQDKNKAWVAEMKDVRAQVDQPQDGVILLDVRRFDEYQTEGKIPTAILFPHTDNFYGDGTFKDTQATRLDYLDEGIKPEDQIIIYCRSGMRAAASFLKLYDSGYTNLKLYDGSYLEWSANPNNPVERPDGAASEAPSSRDAS